MGSCRSIGLVKPKTPTQVLSNEKTPLCKIYSVSINEIAFLSLLFRELCIRNNSKTQLEKSTFLTLIPIPGMIGERIFDYYDKNKDGYIDEETFFHLIEKFSKCEAVEIYQELFLLCDFKNDNVIDRAEFSQAINGILLDVINTMEPTLVDTNILGGQFNKLSCHMSSISTIGSSTEWLIKPKQSPEYMVDSIFEKYSSNSIYLTFPEFKQLISSQFWILARLREGFKVDSWKNEEGMKLKLPKIVQNFNSQKANFIQAKVYVRGKWLKKILNLKDMFLVIYSEKRKLEQVFLIEGCHFRKADTFLYLIYSSQYEERIVFQFESDLECTTFLNSIKEANPIKKFQDFYRQEEKIGFGKFSEVYKTTEILTGTTWAVKIINKVSMNQAEREMIRKEISILKNFQHPGIIKIKEVFDSRKSVKIVLEYVKGGDLLKKIKSEEVKEAKVKEIIKKILEIVKYLHSFGVIHRDLKPENILIIEENEETHIKFIDFGLATYTLPGEIKQFRCGTLGYTAPEVFTGKYTNKIDIWSIGVILFAYLTGKLPFFSYSRTEMVELTQTQEPAYETADWEKFSPQVLELTKLLLNKNPDLRPTSEEVLAHPWFLD